MPHKIEQMLYEKIYILMWPVKISKIESRNIQLYYTKLNIECAIIGQIKWTRYW